MPVVMEQGEFLENIFLIDTFYFGFKKGVTAFCYWDGESCLLMDVGTSDNVEATLKFLKEYKIPLSKVKGILGTHYHFDHMGGATKLWKILVKKNPNFKIIVSKETYYQLQNAEEHLIGANTTFKGLVGTMEPAPESAYKIVKTDTFLQLNIESDYKFQLVSLPGHSHDYNAPTIYKNGETLFCFSGEAAGNQYREHKPVSSLTSMPPNFNFGNYINSVGKIINLKPHSLGINHFGAIIGQEECISFLEDSINHTSKFREDIIKYHKINPSVRFILDNIAKTYFDERGMMHPGSKVALTYGMMIDLGFRKPKYEKRVIPQ